MIELIFRKPRQARARYAPLAVAVELAFFGHTLKGLAGTLDAVLMFVALGRQQLHDLVAAAGARAPHRAGGEINRLSNMEFVRSRSRFTYGSGRGETFPNGFLG